MQTVFIYPKYTEMMPQPRVTPVSARSVLQRPNCEGGVLPLSHGKCGVLGGTNMLIIFYADDVVLFDEHKLQKMVDEFNMV